MPTCRCGAALVGHFKSCEVCRRKNNVSKRKYREANKSKGMCESCGIREPAPGCKRCRGCLDSGNRSTPQEKKAYFDSWRTRLKQEVVEAYGGKCQCCGETTFEFLTIDHIHGGGTRHRKSLTQHFYVALRDAGYPKDDYQLLCMNCNWAKGKYGYCPHERGSYVGNDA